MRERTRERERERENERKRTRENERKRMRERTRERERGKQKDREILRDHQCIKPNKNFISLCRNVLVCPFAMCGNVYELAILPPELRQLFSYTFQAV